MRVALLTPEFPGAGPSFGIGTYTAGLAVALRQAGHDVLVLAATDAGCFRVDAGGIAAARRWTPHSLLLRPLAVGPWLRRELAAFAPDVVEAPNWGGLAWPLPRRLPLVIRLSTSVVDAVPATSLLRPLRLAVERLCVRRADALISDSQAMARASRTIYGRDPDAIVLHAIAAPEKPPSREGRPPAALFVGRIDPRKGADILLAAWPAVRRALPDAVLHLVGGGQERLGALPDGVVAHGLLDDAALAALRAACRVQVVPSRFESFGLVVLEAWSHGLCPVVSDAGALAEVVGDAGRVAPREDPAALAAALVATLPEAWAGLADLGWRRLRERYSIVAWAAASVAVYADAVARRTGRPA